MTETKWILAVDGARAPAPFVGDEAGARKRALELQAAAYGAAVHVSREHDAFRFTVPAWPSRAKTP